MYTKLEEHILMMQISIGDNKKVTGKEQKETDSKFDKIYKMEGNILYDFDNTSPNKVETNKPQYYNTVVHSNRKNPPLEGGIFQKIGQMWTLKHDICPPKFYELIIKNDLKVYTGIYLKDFHNNVNIFLNAVTRLRKRLFSDFRGLFLPYFWTRKY